MKRVDINKCEIEIIECDCGYHLGVDSTFIDQVNHFTTICPSCNKTINTKILDELPITLDFKTSERLELLLHAILNGGKEVGRLLKTNCNDYEPTNDQEQDIVEEIDVLYGKIKELNELANS